MKRSLSARAPLALAALLAACGTAPPTPPARQQAVSLNLRGVELHRQGDHAGAARLFNDAANRAQAIEYEDGLAQSLLNLARTLQAQGRPAESEAALVRLLEGAAPDMPPVRRAEAMLQRALLALGRGEHEAALRWHGQAQAACAGSGAGASCALGPALQNLGARLALERGDAAVALRQALAALAQHRSAGNRIETANALRLAGAAELAQRRPAQAAPLLREALQLDKALAQSDKICHDLILLGHAAAGPERRAYWRRALAVAAAAGLRREQGELEARLAALPATD